MNAPMFQNRSCFVLLAILVASARGCQRPPADAGPPATVRLEPPTDQWLGFQGYLGARGLCHMFVDGFAEGGIPAGGQWRSFATRDVPAAVASAYGATALADGTFELRHPQNRILSIHPAAGEYPSCEHRPRTGETTVIVVSHFYGVK